MNFVGTFVSGFEKYISNLLSEKLKDVKDIHIYDGLATFSTNDYKKIPSLIFFNNVYLLLNKCNIKSSDFNYNIKEVIKVSINYQDIRNVLYNQKYRTFKIKAFKENQPTKFDFRLVSRLESEIKSNLRISITNNPDTEFVIQERSEGFILFMFKITNSRLTEKSISKGALKPELSYLLVSLANLSSDDIVLDPFFGSGSIPRTILRNFNYNMLFASDLDHECVIKLKNEYKNNNKKLFIKEKDATNLDCFESNFIDVIITDPPWNIFNKDESIDFSKFYNSMLLEFNRILKVNGRLIILMGNQVEFDSALSKVKTLEIVDKISILVNGKKATTYSLIKK